MGESGKGSGRTAAIAGESGRDLFMIRTILLALILLGTSATSRAAEISPRDALAIRAVITDQLDAFTQDDAPRAFSLATAGIRAQFGTPEAFINMVRSAYPVVYRRKTVRFEEPAVIEGEIIQPVRMTDAAGRTWLALYPMQRESNGGWRINGCQLATLPGLET